MRKQKTGRELLQQFKRDLEESYGFRFIDKMDGPYGPPSLGPVSPDCTVNNWVLGTLVDGVRKLESAIDNAESMPSMAKRQSATSASVRHNRL